MNVKELAEYLKISEMMVYKLAQKGDIPASKIGSNWRFEEGEVDRWLLRQRDVPTIPAEAKVTVDDIVAESRRVFGDNFLTAFIFGSFARGENEPDSDLDLLIVFKNLKDRWKTDKIVHEIVYSSTFEKERTIVVSPLIMSESEFFTGTSPTILNIRKEGIKAA